MSFSAEYPSPGPRNVTLLAESKIRFRETAGQRAFDSYLPSGYTTTPLPDGSFFRFRAVHRTVFNPETAMTCFFNTSSLFLFSLFVDVLWFRKNKKKAYFSPNTTS